MPRKCSYRDLYKSTGYCRILGAAGADVQRLEERAAKGVATRSARRAERSAAMDAIVDRYVTAQPRRLTLGRKNHGN